MKRTFLFALCLMALPMSTMAQMILLSSEKSKNKLWLDPNSIFDYNQYEKSRWGVGLQYDIRFKNEKNQTEDAESGRFKALSFSGYGAYGYADQRFKWGVKADLQGASKRQSHTYLEFIHDLIPAASRTLTTPAINVLSSPSSFMTRLFGDTYRLTLGYSRKATKKLSESVELRLSRERPLYNPLGQPDQWGLLYPDSYSDLKSLEPYNFAELQFHLEHTSGWSGKMEIGIFKTDAFSVRAFLRTLVQYNRIFTYSFLDLYTFGQAGFVKGNESVPYSRLFDLGGSWGSPLLLNHALLTTRQNEFTSSLFCMANLKLTTHDPLFDFYNTMIAMGTSPHPFILANAAWGVNWEETDYRAPKKGIAEVGAGIDGVFVWGMVYWGFGVVYRLTPESADYHYSNPKNNLTFLLTATLDL